MPLTTLLYGLESDMGETMANSSLGFLSLPPEVRNMIYIKVFGNSILEVMIPHQPGPQRPQVQFVRTNRNLLISCKTINEEARPILEAETVLRIPHHLIRIGSLAGTHGLPDMTHTALESFTRKIVLTANVFACQVGKLDLSAFRQLRCLEFELDAMPCCVRKIFKGASHGQPAADILQRHWLDNQARGWGLLRRIQQIEVTENEDAVGCYQFRITLNTPRSASMGRGGIMVSYSEL